MFHRSWFDALRGTWCFSLIIDNWNDAHEPKANKATATLRNVMEDIILHDLTVSQFDRFTEADLDRHRMV
jgi:hypothetical protein